MRRGLAGMAVSLAALVTSACDGPSAAPTASVTASAAAEPIRTRTRGNLDPKDLVEQAQALIQNWRARNFDGELAAYGPTDSGIRAAEALLATTCRGNAIWRRVEGFHERVSEIASAAASSKGDVVYAPFWEKGPAPQTIMVGVRLPDRQCAAVDTAGGVLAADGDGEIVSLLLAAEAIRQSGYDDARSTPSPSVRDAAIAWVSDFARSPPIAAADAASPADPRDHERVYSKAEFRSLLEGRSKEDVIALLGRPIAVNDSLPPGSQSYDYSSDEPYLGHVGFRVVDETTGVTLRSVTVDIGFDGRVSGITF